MKISNIANKVRDGIVILYEISVLFIPFILMYNMSKGIINEFTAAIIVFVYTLPLLFHLGVFGDTPQRLADKIMGYEKILTGEVTSDELTNTMIQTMIQGTTTETHHAGPTEELIKQFADTKMGTQKEEQ